MCDLEREIGRRFRGRVLGVHPFANLNVTLACRREQLAGIRLSHDDTSEILAEPYNHYVLRTRPKRAPIVARRTRVLRRVILDAASSLVAIALRVLFRDLRYQLASTSLVLLGSCYNYFGASAATIFSKRRSPRDGSQLTSLCGSRA